jgi:hypothetical protein
MPFSRAYLSISAYVRVLVQDMLDKLDPGHA